MKQDVSTTVGWMQMTDSDLHMIAKNIPSKHWDNGLTYNDEEDERIIEESMINVRRNVELKAMPDEQLNFVVRFLLDGRRKY